VAVSSWTLVAISCERYYAICHPLRSRTWQTINHANKIIAIIWLGSLVCMTPIAAFSQLMPTSRPGECEPVILARILQLEAANLGPHPPCFPRRTAQVPGAMAGGQPQLRAGLQPVPGPGPPGAAPAGPELHLPLHHPHSVREHAQRAGHELWQQWAGPSPGYFCMAKPFRVCHSNTHRSAGCEEVGIWDVATRETGTQLIVVSRPELALGT